MKLLYCILIVTTCTFFSYCKNYSGDNFDKSVKIEPIDKMNSFVFSSNEQFLAKAVTGKKIDLVNSDSTYYVEFQLYETNEEFQEKYDLDTVCEIEEIDECDDDIVFDIEDFKLLRIYTIEEKLAKYYTDFSGIYSVVTGTMEWIDEGEKTVLFIQYFGTKIYLTVFDQNAHTWETIDYN